MKKNRSNKRKRLNGMRSKNNSQTSKNNENLGIFNFLKIKKNSIIGIIGVLIVAGMIFSFSGGGKNTEMNSMMNEHVVSLSAQDKKVTMYKDPNCGCCSGYADELRKNGFEVTIIKEKNMRSIKNKYGISPSIESCHTSVFDNGYVVEGHTPVEAVMKMINEKPQINGIGMGGMPSGSAGMPGMKRAPFKVYTIEKDNSNNLYLTI